MKPDLAIVAELRFSQRENQPLVVGTSFGHCIHGTHACWACNEIK